MAINPENYGDRAVRVEIGFLEGLRSRFPDNDLILKALGDLYTCTGAHQKGLEIDERLVILCPDEPAVWYNLGCSYAIMDRKDDAFKALFHAIKLGYADDGSMRSDKDLESIRRDPRFKKLLKEAASGGESSYQLLS